MELGVQLTIQASVPASRYATDYEEMEELGSGGLGRVMEGQHRLDAYGRFHAVNPSNSAARSWKTCCAR